MQKIDPIFKKIVMTRNITTSNISPDKLKKILPEKLYWERRVLAEFDTAGVTMSLTILKKSDFELKTL